MQFDPEILAKFFPTAYWPVVERVITDGPALASQRLQRITFEWCQTRVKATRRRPEGGQIAFKTVETRVGAARALFDRLRELNMLGEGPPELGAWTYRPPKPRIAASRINSAVPAPPRPIARRAWRAAERSVRGWLGCATSAEEIAVLEGMSDTGLRRFGFRVLRIRALLFLFLVVGARVDAVARLTVGDYDPDRLCADGVRRPAVGLTPRKGVSTRRWKPFPRKAAYVLETYLLYITRRLALEGRELDPGGPLFFSRLSAHDRFPRAETISRKFAGGTTGSSYQVPPVPFDPQLLGVKPSELDGREPEGYTPHPLRRCAFQLVRMAGRQAYARGELELDPETVAEALLDHTIPKDRLGYGDVSPEDGRERWSAVGTRFSWSALTTDLGAQLVRDEEGLRDATRRQSALQVELARVRRSIDRKATEASRAIGASGTEREQLELLRATLERHGGIDELHRLEARLREEISQAEVEIERIRHDPNRRIVVPDEIESPHLGEGAEEIEALDFEEELAAERARRIREWITLAELAELSGAGAASVKRWCAGKLPRPAGHPHNPWELDCVPVDDSQGQKRRRISVAGLKPTFLDAIGARERLEEILASWPKGWKLETCEAPLRVDPPAEG